MRFFCFCIPLFCLCFAEAADTLLQLKEEQQTKLQEIEKALTQTTNEGEKSVLYCKQAIALIEMQKTKEAFLSFLEAIETKEGSPGEVKWDDHMKALMPLYLSMTEHETLLEKELCEREKHVSSSHPLHIIKGCSFANKGDFRSFFFEVYAPIQKEPNSYLAWKMRGVLYSKVFESSSSLEEREHYKKKALDCFLLAYKRLPEDMTLALRLLFFTQANEQEELMYAKQICAEYTTRPLLANWVSKSGMLQVIQECLTLKMYDQVQESVCLYSKMFGYSRTVEEIQKELKVLRNLCE